MCSVDVLFAQRGNTDREKNLLFDWEELEAMDMTGRMAGSTELQVALNQQNLICCTIQATSNHSFFCTNLNKRLDKNRYKHRPSYKTEDFIKGLEAECLVTPESFAEKQAKKQQAGRRPIGGAARFFCFFFVWFVFY